MLNIAICDDDELWLDYTARLLQEYFLTHTRIAAKVHTFRVPFDLLESMEEIGDFDLFILDVVMPEMSGVDLGRKLRKLGCRGLLVYLTSSREFALDAYDAEPFHYLLKPVDRDKLYCVLDKAVGILEDRRNKTMTVKTRDSTTRLVFDDIVYVAYADRCCHYSMKDGGVVSGTQQRESFGTITLPLLKDARFFKCGASLIVNLFYIRAVEKDKVVFSLPGFAPQYLPKNSVTPLLSAWLDYWMEGDRK